jgi:hypothetical protein
MAESPSAGLDGPPRNVPDYLVRAIAVDAQVHPDTVRRVLEGRPTRPMCRARVQAALDRMAARQAEVRP